MIRIGTIGIGFMGFTHFEAARKLRGAKVTAIAESDPKKLAGDWTDIQGNFGPRGGHVDLTGIKTYSDYHDLLADPDIDMVDICLPTDLHAQVVIDALKAGKHTLVEKPISLDTKAAQKMVQTAEKAGKLLMVAHVLPFFPEFQFAAQCIRSGKYGKLFAGHFRRLIAPPTWLKSPDAVRRLGGWGVDLHIHDNHFICSMIGTPKQVFSHGLLQDDLVYQVHSVYVFDDPDLTVSAVSGGINTPGLEFAHGFELHFEKATLQFDAGNYGVGDTKEWVVNRPLSVMTASGKVLHPKLKGGSEWCAAFTQELKEAVQAVKTGEQSATLSGELAFDALKLCHAEAKSIRTGRPVSVG